MDVNGVCGRGKADLSSPAFDASDRSERCDLAFEQADLAVEGGFLSLGSLDIEATAGCETVLKNRQEGRDTGNHDSHSQPEIKPTDPGDGERKAVTRAPKRMIDCGHG